MLMWGDAVWEPGGWFGYRWYVVDTGSVMGRFQKFFKKVFGLVG